MSSVQSASFPFFSLSIDRRVVVFQSARAVEFLFLRESFLGSFCVRENVLLVTIGMLFRSETFFL